MANNQARSDSDFKAMIGEVYDELVEIAGGIGSRLFETMAALTANGAASYALSSLTSSAADHMHTLRVARVQADGTEAPLTELRIQEEWSFKGRTGDATHYALIGTSLYLYPTPASGSYRLYYVPQPADLSAAADGTSVDVLCPAGERFIRWGVALIVHAELEGAAQVALTMKDRAADDLRVWVAQRNLVEPARRISDEDFGESPIELQTWERP